MAISVIKFPVGTFGYVGSVPVDLAYRITGGTCFARKAVRDAIPLSGPGLAKKIAAREGVKMETRTFETAAEAYDVAVRFVDAHNLKGVKVYG
jgi:hypothetical protein